MTKTFMTLRFLSKGVDLGRRSSEAVRAAFAFWGLVLLGAEACVIPGCTTTKSSTARPMMEPAPVASVSREAGNSTEHEVPPSPSVAVNIGATVPSNGTAVTPESVKCPVRERTDLGVPCGDLHCLEFANERSAFEHLLLLEPRVLGIGESHAPRGMEAVHSATRRFGELLLPSLCGRARSIVLELWLPRNDCGDKRVEQVKKAQEPVTRNQSKSNQDEYVTLGHVAKRLGIAPSALVPTCDEYQSILDSGPDRIYRMLEFVAQRTGERVIEELGKFADQKEGPVVIAYGGALHNDAEPDHEHERYSYGPKLLAQTQGKYLELDLIVPEFVKESDIWQRQPWYQAFRQSKGPTKPRLYQWGTHSFALVFPSSPKQPDRPAR